MDGQTSRCGLICRLGLSLAIVPGHEALPGLGHLAWVFLEQSAEVEDRSVDEIVLWIAGGCMPQSEPEHRRSSCPLNPESPRRLCALLGEKVNWDTNGAQAVQ